MSRKKRIVVVNDEIFELSESNYQKAMGKSDGRIDIRRDNYQADHDARCERIRKYGKKIFDADRILRND